MPAQPSSCGCSHQLCSPSMSWDVAPLGGCRLLACLFFFLFLSCLAERPMSPRRVPDSLVVGYALWKSGCCNQSTCELTLKDRNQLWGTASSGSVRSGRRSPAAPRGGAPCPGIGAASKCSPRPWSVPMLQHCRARVCSSPGCASLAPWLDLDMTGGH